ncbi:unnamed protein product [Penicillium pancosmium]
MYTKEKTTDPSPGPELLDALERPEKIHKVVQEAILLAGGAVAILLQVAEPGVAQGVDNHNRLRTTMTYVYCVTFGTRDEKKAVIEMVHRAHASVNGPGYSADDPKLQLWVAATLYAVGIELYQEMFGTFDDADAEAIYREYSVLALSLRVTPDMWPPNQKEFWKYWDNQIATMDVTDNARSVAKDLLRNKEAPLQIRLLLPLVRLTTAQMLPDRLRQAYGLRTSKIRRMTYRFIMGLSRATYPCLPRTIRTYPMKYYMRDMRRRLENAA